MGERAPDFTLVDIDGDEFSLEDFIDNVVILEFFRCWCDYCGEEVSVLENVRSNYDRVAIVSISSENDETITEFRDEHESGWIFASGSQVSDIYEIYYIPTIYVINRQGVIVFKHVGLTSYSTLAAQIELCLEE